MTYMYKNITATVPVGLFFFKVLIFKLTLRLAVPLSMCAVCTKIEHHVTRLKDKIRKRISSTLWTIHTVVFINEFLKFIKEVDKMIKKKILSINKWTKCLNFINEKYMICYFDHLCYNSLGTNVNSWLTTVYIVINLQILYQMIRW